MDVNPQESPLQQTYQGKTYYLCSQECLEEFNQEPQRYIGQKVR